jgi:dCTP deaminase
MILTGEEIIKEVKNGRIKISDFNLQRITTNSYDLLLGISVIKYTSEILDPKKENDFEVIILPKEGFRMNSGEFLLGSSAEIIGSDFFVPIIHAKSGIARKGLFVHCSTGLIDIGSHGRITFQLVSTLPIILYPGMKIAQVTFWKPKGKIKLYNGKYQGSVGPQTSQIFKDF